ncbi:hypothetical protein BHM03_00055102 [Ensete ventricosum]|nr:hypothetical protein BHM03_00055102 [Ensete ventricosum]
MKVEFPIWEDGDPANWISRVKKVFHFYRTPKESMVKIASIQLDDEAIQWMIGTKHVTGFLHGSNSRKDLFTLDHPSMRTLMGSDQRCLPTNRSNDFFLQTDSGHFNPDVLILASSPHHHPSDH